MTIKLYDLCAKDRAVRFSPACWPTRMALAHKGLEVEVVPTLFTDIARIEGGGQKSVPVIADGDMVVRDSFAIALYLERTYDNRPTLFGGEAGEALSRFIHYWAGSFIEGQIARMIIHDIYQKLDPADQPYFRESREARFGRPLQEVQEQTPERIEAFRQSLGPFRTTLYKQPFLGGDMPLYADYCLFGSLQWPRLMSDAQLLDRDDPVAMWFERCLDLHGGLGRAAKA
ncbi:Glutathione S-transferase [Cohaesibacter sp. ES.047]|uniref:glutathione S-transferase family protein n=1 Tax=Cohaesibacter sp. ES.047 TaxID=1798205 RepID=UPI000BB8FF32|nr:glutathione S-transferase family protein [Cohaesibacter sp. ES.047]SNY93820.1 Glutathione S-transferase [Cohaesibacter sp. ES.047]